MKTDDIPLRNTRKIESIHDSIVPPITTKSQPPSEARAATVAAAAAASIYTGCIPLTRCLQSQELIDKVNLEISTHLIKTS